MVDLRDIYYKVGRNLYEQEFDFQKTKQKKEMIDDTLKTYLIDKVTEESMNQALKTHIESDVTVDDLVVMLGDLIPEEKHFDIIRHLTHFILNVAGEMQDWSITWYSESDPAFIDNPAAEFNAAGKLDCIKTHENHSYVTAFKQVYGLFQNAFMVKENTNKKLVMHLPQPSKSNE